MTRFPVLLALAAALAACHANHDDDVVPTDDRQAAASAQLAQAKRVVVDADDLDRAQIEELARHIQGLGDVAQAKVKVRKEEGHTDLVVEISGTDLPSDDYLQKEVATFPGLEDADVAVETVHPDELGGPVVDAAEEGKSAEEIKAEVEARLRSEGVEGDVQVDVHDEDGERRVEVRVHKKGDAPTDDLATEQP